jgi:hypothetical protein
MTRTDIQRALARSTERREQSFRATTGYFPHHESRRGPKYQARVPSRPMGSSSSNSAASQRERTDPLRRVLDAAPDFAPRATCCEEAGTPVWSPHVLPDAALQQFIAAARTLTSPAARFDLEALLALLAANNYDVPHTLAVYRFQQDSISRQILETCKR